MNWKRLLLSMALDLVGILSAGWFQDVIWAPLSAYLLIKMYPGSIGKVAGTIEFLEELLPFTDIIPTFTITYLYDTFFTQKQSKKTPGTPPKKPLT